MARRIHIVGRKNSGKTTLIVELVQELTRLGYRVGTIKHTHHNHELDTPGKDSHRHRQAGASAVGILSQKMNAVFWPQDTRDRGSDRDVRYDLFHSLMQDCDVLLVEGDSSTSAIKVEVWRSETADSPLSEQDASIAAVITDDMVAVANAPILPRSNLPKLVQWLVSKLEISASGGNCPVHNSI